MTTEAWIGALFFFLFGLFAFISILFPQWDIRWGGSINTLKPHNEMPPMSNTGKALFGAFGMCGALGGLAATALNNKIARYAVVAIMISILIAMFPVYLRDKEKFNSQNSQD